MRRLALVIASLLLSGFAVPAQAQRFLVHTYRDNLPGAFVTSVAQGRDGRIWAATPSGLACYDGANWVTYGTEHGLPSRNVARVVVDSDGMLWSAGPSDSIRVSRFHGGRWSPLPAGGADRNAEVTSMIALPREGEDLLVVGLSSGEVGVWNGEWSLFRTPAQVKSLAWWDGRLWVGTQRGLAAYTVGGDGGLVPDPGVVPAYLRDRQTLALAPDGDHLWIYGEAGLGRVEDGRFRIVPDNHPRRSGSFSTASIAPDGHGGVYFGAPAFVAYYRPTTGFEPLGTASGLLTEGATDMVHDREGNLWIGSLRGLSKLVSRRFATYDASHGLLADEVSAVIRRRSGEMVLSHPRGLTFIDGSGPRTLRLSDQPVISRALDLAEGADGTVWVAGNELGLGEFRDDMIIWHDPSGRGAPVTSVVPEDGGRIWCGAGSLYVRDDEEQGFRPVELPTEAEFFIRRLAAASDGSVLVATAGAGLFRVRDGSPEGPFLAATGEEISLYTVYEGGDGTVWVGAGAGLFRLDGDRLERAELGGRSIRRPVFLLVEDAAGDLWIGTDHGAARWDGESVRNFTPVDGLAGLETNRAAGYADPDGHVWIGTERGVSVYRPEFDPPSPHGPTVALLPMDVDGTLVPLADGVNLQAGDDTVIFRFLSISFVDEDHVRFRVWLEGFDPQWLPVQALPQRSIRYTNLPPGDYRFHIQAVDARGARSDVVRSPPVHIRRALVDNPWFRVAVALAALGMMVSVVVVLVQRRYANHLEAVVRSRTEELRGTERELARAQRLEALGVLAGGIAHDFNNLLQVILGGASLLEVTGELEGRPRTVLTELKRAAKRAQQLTDQLLTFAKGGEPVRRTMDVAPIIQESAAVALTGSGIPGEVEIAQDLWAVNIDAGQIGRALDNLILNARQAMPPDGNVTVRGSNVTYAPPPAPGGPHVLIEIRDEGPGIPQTEIGRIFDPFYSTKPEGTGLGLAVAHSVVERHGGHLSVESSPGQGATFRLRLPAVGPHPDSPPEPVAARPVSPAPAAVRAGGQRVLVMDDEDPVRRAVVEMLSELGYEATATRDGDEAVRQYRRAFQQGHPHDVLLLDVRIPGGGGGREALRRILAFDPDARAIVITGYSEDAVLSDPDSFGFCGSLAKPFTTQELGAVLATVLDAPRPARLT